MAICFRQIYLETNQGHGIARRTSLSACTNELVALMDSDDISLPTRFERELAVFERNPEVSIVGGQIAEFIGDQSNIIGTRIVPEDDKTIKEYMKSRCPMNQVSVMFRKDFIESVGGYIDWHCEEDYYLWIRSALAGGIFTNVPETLVNVRVGNEMSARRGGWKYFLSEAKIQKLMLQKRVISPARFLYNVAVRFGGEVLITPSVRTKLFRILRSKPEEAEYVVPPDSQFEAEKRDHMPFSVSMCVYAGDKAEWFDAALNSVIYQTIRPDEIVLVVDGPVPDSIRDVIRKYQRICETIG